MTRRHHISHPRLVAACACFSGCVVGLVWIRGEGADASACRDAMHLLGDADTDEAARAAADQAAGLADGHSAASAATANVSSARVESGPDSKETLELSQSG